MILSDINRYKFIPGQFERFNIPFLAGIAGAQIGAFGC